MGRGLIFSLQRAPHWAENFEVSLWFPPRSSRLCRFSSRGSTRSPEAEEVLRRQDVRWRADGRCTQSIRRTLRVARPRSSLRIFLARGIPNRCISLFFSSRWEPAAQPCALDRSSYSRRARRKSTVEANYFWKNWGQTERSPISIRRKIGERSVCPGFPQKPGPSGRMFIDFRLGLRLHARNSR